MMDHLKVINSCADVWL